MESMDKRYGSTFFDLIENEIIEDEKKLHDLIESYKNITEQLDSLIEKKSVFDKSSQLMSSQQSNINFQKDSFSLTNNQTETIETFLKNKNNIPLIPETDITDVNFISGVIKAEDSMKLKRMIFRASRGRAIPTFFDLTIENKTLKTKQEKKIFVVLYQGGADDVLVQKILYYCDLLNCSRFTIPKREEISSAINALQHEIYEKKTFLKTAETSIKDFIKDKIGVDGVPGKYDKYRLFFLQEKFDESE
jgi:vacuolar-type H+-ATPase subunit I/STV1